MAEHHKSHEARKGLFDSMKGKAKEFAGAVIGNDSLTAEGQLDQAQAQNRKEANSVEAVADAEADQARAEAVDDKQELAHERFAVASEAAAKEKSVQADQAAQKRAVEQAKARDAATQEAQIEHDAERNLARVKAQEQEDVRAAADHVAAAVDDHSTVEHIATNAHEEADRMRARADRMTNEAELP